MLVVHSLNSVITDEDQDITWHWINLKDGWFTVVQNAESTFVDTKQKLICRWLKEGDKHRNQTFDILIDCGLIASSCDVAIKKEKVGLLTKEEVLLVEISLWHLSALTCTIAAVYDW